ncbi:MAG: HEAT repeat domain-containing protein, partial [Planctomycetota bacterium]
MSRSFISLVAVSLGICLTACFCVSHESPWARAADAPASKISAEDFLVQGQPLKYWIAQTTAKEPAVDRGKVIAALAEAVGNNDATVKVAAADALATFGPDSKAAMPALLPLLSDSRPWVSSAGITSLAAIGKEAVPTLIDHYQNGPAAARIRAAFALGGIGRDAQAAVPVLAAAMEKESPVMQERLQGILSLIDPEKYPAPTIVGKAKFEQGEAATSD